MLIFMSTVLIALVFLVPEGVGSQHPSDVFNEFGASPSSAPAHENVALNEEGSDSSPSAPSHSRHPSHLPPDHSPDHMENEEQLYVQIQRTPTNILAHLSPNAPILGVARNGDVFPLIAEGRRWCTIVYDDTTGWVERRHVEIVTAPSSVFLADAKALLFAIAIIVFIVLVIGAIITWRHIKAEKLRGVVIPKNALIIAAKDKTVHYMLSDVKAPLERCFTEIGFKVNKAHDLMAARNIISHSPPDLVLVDWQFAPGVLTVIERMFSQHPSASNALFLFYNIPDPSSVHLQSVLPNIGFLGLTFSDRDIFKLVTPLIITAEKSMNIQKSVKSSALEGIIKDGNLLEVLQFIEIGSKTGCLMIETKSPFGLMYFNRGRIIYAATPKSQGKKAIFSILNLKSGKFRFVLNKTPKSANLNLSTLEILMEWTKELDEATGH
ncbi:DUF4388 domain-containing protein [Chitinispirillales bacterium ANBcel5]|uniref:DUF4388 domain-containing protein n=1 Tax=Cellulosispirillum alkaliphilum TaxID=3039283 RepID=UPI002A559F25|nr:DUF4388 domain-containing protein [Chitinispirillales bacterium ANBcel5]